ncbi:MULTISPECIES: TIGR01906 family membrane protein [unclassified Dorea]|uniref:TIGR01906 family membrane protein n=1 Tax=unclassified Dorea TaxID=2627917 RepID=UPI000E492D62|nr:MULTISPECIES: TIGR01906 family membrane protein [unclassified Dorea]RGY79660.1 TIGR01906 family membrane protein [Dorea sp. AM58-8]RHP10665.1 TIGR01906 family membrane protein [Dorea sp. AF36-15AT]
MKQTQKISAVIMMFLLIGVLLLTSFQVAIYGDSQYRFYEREYKKYQVADSLNMTMDNIMDVTDQMMAYLIGNKAELSVITDVDGETQDFFNEQDRFHMGEVKNLFLGGLKIRNIMLVAVLLILILLAARKADMIKLLPRAYFVTLGITGVITIVLGGLFASDFDKYFRIFHEIFFDNDQWMFDPATDYMIRMLPEGFFYDFVFRIGGFFVGSLAVLGVVSAVCIFMEKHKKKN